MKCSRGVTLIELLVVFVLIGVLAAVVMPSVGSSILNARGRTVVYAFMQSFAGLRSVAASGNHVVVLNLNGDCSWAATVDGAADTAHSSTAKLMSSASTLACTGAPVAFTFGPQGYVAPQPKLVFSVKDGNTGLVTQQWTLTVLASGAILKS